MIGEYTPTDVDLKQFNHKEHLLSMTVAPDVVSVRPYPWITSVHKHNLICSCVSGDNGAPPAIIKRTRPPINFEIFLNINLEKFRREHDTLVFFSFSIWFKETILFGNIPKLQERNRNVRNSTESI